MAQKTKTDLITSGIPGLDQALGGGFVRNRAILLCGLPGTGKTTLAMQFLYSGTKNKEPGAFISFDEDEDHLLAHIKHFNWGMEDMQNKDMLRIQKVGALEIQQFASQESILLTEIIRSIKAKRVVVDTLTTYELLFQQDYERMLYIKRLVSEIISQGCTLIATSESVPGRISRFQISEYIFDSVINLEVDEKAKTKRTLEILKNRGNAHRIGKNLMDITQRGVEVYPLK